MQIKPIAASNSLANIPTAELHAELIRRDGVRTVFLGPEDRLTHTVQGPAWVVVNRD